MSHRTIRSALVVATCLFCSGASATVINGPVVRPATGSTYYLLSQANWTDSEAEAKTLGGNLTTIDDAAEQGYIVSTFQSGSTADYDLWTGLYDPDSTANATDRALRRAEFVWVDGSSSIYRNWSPVEPNNPKSTDPATPECFVHLWHSSDPYGHRWNNLGDNTVIFSRELHGVVELSALPGDANLDRLVNFDDLLILAKNYGVTSGSDWLHGDFDQTASVDFNDLLVLAKHYNAGVAAAQADFALAQTLVPEPTMLVAAAIAPMFVWTRRVRTSSSAPLSRRVGFLC